MPIFTNAWAEYCPLDFNAPPRDLIVTPVSATNVICPAPYWVTKTCAPVENGCAELAGTVKLLAEATFISTNLPVSEVTKV